MKTARTRLFEANSYRLTPSLHSMQRERKFPVLCQIANACASQIHQTSSSSQFVLMFCDVLPQPISNRFIYHTDFILCHFHYLLFNCLNYLLSLIYSNSKPTILRKREQMMAVALEFTSNHSIFDSQSATKTQTLANGIEFCFHLNKHQHKHILIFHHPSSLFCQCATEEWHLLPSPYALAHRISHLTSSLI